MFPNRIFTVADFGRVTEVSVSAGHVPVSVYCCSDLRLRRKLQEFGEVVVVSLNRLPHLIHKLVAIIMAATPEIVPVL